MTKQDIIERAKRVSFSSNPKDYIDFVGELAKENETIPEDVQEAAKAYEDSLDYHECMSQWPSVGYAAGMLAERERLMKDAVDGEVVSDLKNVNYVRTMSKIPDTLYFGEKVNVIIIKKDDGGVLEKYENRFGDTIHNTDD